MEVGGGSEGGRSEGGRMEVGGGREERGGGRSETVKEGGGRGREE